MRVRYQFSVTDVRLALRDYAEAHGVTLPIQFSVSDVRLALRDYAEAHGITLPIQFSLAVFVDGEPDCLVTLDEREHWLEAYKEQ